MSHYRQVVVYPGFIDVDGFLLSRGAFHKGVPGDSVHFPVLDEGVARVFIGSPELPLHPNLRGQSGVEDKLPKKFLIYQVLKVSSEDSAVHCEVAPPFVESTVVRRFRPFRVRWERSGRPMAGP